MTTTTIHKYPFEVEDEILIYLPTGARVLSVQVQGGKPCMWALVDTRQPVVTRRFYIYGTGHPVEREGTFLGTFQLFGGSLVFHVFEEKTQND